MAAATGQTVTPEVPAVAATKEAAAPSKVADVSWWLRFREMGVAVFVVVAAVVAYLIEPRFASTFNVQSILGFIPLIVVVAMGQMMVIVSRNIDLSVGSMLALSAIVVGYIFVGNYDFPLWLAFLVAIGVGGGLGLMNGVLITLLRVPSIIATLGTLTAYRGLVFIYSGAKQVSNYQLPESLHALKNPSPIGVPWLILFAAIVAALTALFLRYTRLGRDIYAVGSNPLAAQLRGIAVKKTLLTVFTITGALSGLAGILWAARYGNISPSNTGQGFELIVISAVIIGGTSVFGGSGTVLGVLLGCLLLAVISVAITVVGISGFWQTAVYGLAILLAATVDTLIQRRMGKSAAAAGGAG